MDFGLLRSGAPSKFILQRTGIHFLRVEMRTSFKHNCCRVPIQERMPDIWRKRIEIGKNSANGVGKELGSSGHYGS